MELVFMNPPEVRNTRSRKSMYDEMAQQLKSRPEEWALIKKANKRQTFTRPFFGPDYERAYRKETIDGTVWYCLYARYVGPYRESP